MDDVTAIVKKIPESHKNVINHILKKIIGNADIESIFLFGSCAKGLANESSDIDLFIVTYGKIIDNSYDTFNILYGSTDDIPLTEYISCDIFTVSVDDFYSEATPLIKCIKREGVKLRGLL